MRLKIGFTSSNPYARLATLQTGSPTELTVMAVRPGTMDDERRLHEEFAEERVRGEWFQMSERLFRHMFFVVLDNAADAIRAGEPFDRLTRVGLEALREIEPLPDCFESRLQ
jgi:hypothetical protein